MQQGWISIHRKIRECFIWNEEPYDKAHAWIDLLLRANHDDKKVLINGQVQTVERGQFHTSLYKLAHDWQWDRRKVKRFLEMLEKERMIATSCNVGGTTNGTTITIVNYEKYQGEGIEYGTTDGTTVGTTVGTTDGTTHGTKTIMSNNENNENNENNIYNHLSDGMSEKTSDLIQSIVDEYNMICVSFPRVTKLSDSRKKAIKARLKQYTRDDFTTMFEKAEASNFLKGGNNRNWCADFDWMIKDANMAKILDGNYDKDKPSVSGGKASGSSYIDAINNRFDPLIDWASKGD